MATLFRPVGLNELALIWDSDFREFPPRLPHQPFFYPVVNVDYARQIASTWNVKDEASGNCGYVTRFNVRDGYLSEFEPHVAGTGVHLEYWIPAEQLGDFNHAITEPITVDEAFFGSEFVGFVPEKFGLRGHGAIEQFVMLAKTWDYSRMDFTFEVFTNRKAVFLNSWFWAHHDFSSSGIDDQHKRDVMRRIRDAWKHHQLNFSLPRAYSE